MANEIIRKHSKDKSVPHYKIAEAMKMSEFQFSRLLRDELEADVQGQIIHLIDRISGDPNKGDAQKVNQKSSETMRRALADCMSPASTGNDTKGNENKKKTTKKKEQPEEDWLKEFQQ